MNHIGKLYIQEVPNWLRRVFCPGLGACLLAIAVISNVHATPLYDFTQMLSEPHPFADAVLDIGPASSQTIPANQLKASAIPAWPVRQAASGLSPIETSPVNRRAGPKRNLYLSALLIGSVATVDDLSISNGNTLEITQNEDLVAGLGIVLGYSWPRQFLPLRTEVEYHYRVRMDLDTLDIDTPGRAGYQNNLSTHAVFLNAYYDFELGRKWTLYGGGGIGWVRNVSDVSRQLINTVGRTNRTDETDNIGWNAALGALWHFSMSSWSADFRYRYIDLGEVESGPHIDGAIVRGGSYTSHDVIAGITYRF